MFCPINQHYRYLCYNRARYGKEEIISMHNTNDRFPYEQEFRTFKIRRDNVLIKTADDYCNKLALFFEELRQSNVIFNRTNDVTKISVSDIDNYFYYLSSVVSPRTYNNIHKVINQYYRFLLVQKRLNVPPLIWTITTQKIESYLSEEWVDWDNKIDQVLGGNLQPREKLSFLLFAKGLSLTQMCKKDMPAKTQNWEWRTNEFDFLNGYSNNIFQFDYFFYHRDGAPLAHKTVAKLLSKANQSIELTQKHALLKENARIHCISAHQLNAEDIYERYQIKVGGTVSNELINKAKRYRVKYESKL
jgi:hypothetical protein